MFKSFWLVAFRVSLKQPWHQITTILFFARLFLSLLSSVSCADASLLAEIRCRFNCIIVLQPSCGTEKRFLTLTVAVDLYIALGFPVIYPPYLFLTLHEYASFDRYVQIGIWTNTYKAIVGFRNSKRVPPFYPDENVIYFGHSTNHL